MELKDFVKSAILDIIEGVREAQGVNTTDAVINANSQVNDVGVRRLVDVEFDVVLSAQSTLSGDGKLEVSAARILDGELEGTVVKDSSNMSRVKFTIPVRFPSPHKP